MQTLDWYDLKKSGVIFQHDNDPKNPAHSTKKWLKENMLTTLPWPAQYLDMNPIEHLWNELDGRIRNRSDLPTSVLNVWDIIQEEWEKIPTEFCQKLIKSMPERAKDLKKVKGEHYEVVMEIIFEVTA